MANKSNKGNPGEERFVATGKSVTVLPSPTKKKASKPQKKGGR